MFYLFVLIINYKHYIWSKIYNLKCPSFNLPVSSPHLALEGIGTGADTVEQDSWASTPFLNLSKTWPKASSLASFSGCSTHTMHHQVLPDFSVTPPPQKLQCLPIVSPLWGPSPVLPLSLSSALLEKSSLLFPFWVYLPYILQSEEHTTNATSVPSQPSSSPLPVSLVNTCEFLGGSDSHSTTVCSQFPASHQ